MSSPSGLPGRVSGARGRVIGWDPHRLVSTPSRLHQLPSPGLVRRCPRVHAVGFRRVHPIFDLGFPRKCQCLTADCSTTELRPTMRGVYPNTPDRSTGQASWRKQARQRPPRRSDGCTSRAPARGPPRPPGPSGLMPGAAPRRRCRVWMTTAVRHRSATFAAARFGENLPAASNRGPLLALRPSGEDAVAPPRPRWSRSRPAAA